MNDDLPATEPTGDLGPPNRQPPAGIATATPPAPLPQRRDVHPARREGALLRLVRRIILRGLDLGDEVAAVVTGRNDTR